MYRKVEDYESEVNALRRQNKDLKQRLEKMQNAIRRYQVEKTEFMKKYGITKMGPKLEVKNDVILEDTMERT
jgi:predicted RNase H-like nuclease (RuvC/YqgF family)